MALIYDPEARAELIEAAAYYDNQTAEWTASCREMNP